MECEGSADTYAIAQRLEEGKIKKNKKNTCALRGVKKAEP